MKVEQLIEFLQALPKDASVCLKTTITDDEGYVFVYADIKGFEFFTNGVFLTGIDKESCEHYYTTNPS